MWILIDMTNRIRGIQDPVCLSSDRDKSCSSLPRIPCVKKGPGLPWACHTAFVGEKLYIFGGSIDLDWSPSGRVFMLDLTLKKKLWVECARMKKARMFYGPAIQVHRHEGRIYVLEIFSFEGDPIEPEMYTQETNS